MNKKVRPAILVFAIGALAFSLGYVVFSEESAHSGAARDYSQLRLDPGAPAADFTLTRLDGTEVTRADYEGKIVIVDFWATWCGPCLTEIPAYNALYEDYKDEGVELLGITLQSGSAEQVREWLSRPVRVGTTEVQLDYPVVMGNDDIEMTWGPIYGFPTTYLVDHDWKIRKKWLGAVPDKSEQIRHLIEELLEKRAAEPAAAAD